MNEIKLHDVIKRFGGRVGEDVAVWFRQVKLVAKLRKIKDLAVVLPLFLDGAAFAVYEQLEDVDKENADKIESTLSEAFGVDSFQAYEEFRGRKRLVGESVDVFLSELRRLASLAGCNDDNLLRTAFVVGLSRSVSMQLRATPGIQKMMLSKVLSLARVLISEQRREELNDLDQNSTASSAAVALKTNSGRKVIVGRQAVALQCFGCGGPHLRRVCPQIKCFRCNENGHKSYCCPMSGNVIGESCAPVRSQ